MGIDVPAGVRLPVAAEAMLDVVEDSAVIVSRDTALDSDGSVYALAGHAVDATCADITSDWCTSDAAYRQYDRPGSGAVTLRVALSPGDTVEMFSVNFTTTGSFRRAVANAVYVAKDDASAWIRSKRERAEDAAGGRQRGERPRKPHRY